MVDEAIAKDEGQRHINTTAFAGNRPACIRRGADRHNRGWLEPGMARRALPVVGRGGGYSATDPVYYNTAVIIFGQRHTG